MFITDEGLTAMRTRFTPFDIPTPASMEPSLTIDHDRLPAPVGAGASVHSRFASVESIDPFSTGSHQVAPSDVTLVEYQTQLKSHNWHYGYSKDLTVFEKGYKREQSLRECAEAQGGAFRTLWDAERDSRRSRLN